MLPGTTLSSGRPALGGRSSFPRRGGECGAASIRSRFDDFVEEFNTERPHQALDMACLAERYSPSPRPYRGLPELDYPFYDKAVTVTTCGRICFDRKKINLSLVFAGQTVGIKQVEDRIWLASFMDYDLGYFDDETGRLEPLENPFGPKVLPMSPV